VLCRWLEMETPAPVGKENTTGGPEPRAAGVRRCSKATLASLLRNPGAIRLSEHISADGPEVFAHACRLGAEGIVSKRLGSPYRSGLCDAWIKCKNPAAVAVQRERGAGWNR
jgi:hypothetical protein